VQWTLLVREHGYALTFVGSILEGETILTLAGLAAHRGYLHLPWLIVIGAIGSSIGDQTYFVLGRRFGDRLMMRFPRWRIGAARVDVLVRRHPAVSVVAVRFLYGLRTVGPIAIGMSDMPWHRFAVFNAIGAVLWATCWACAGYLVGNVATLFFGDLEHIEKWLFSGAAVIAVIVVGVLRYRRAAGLAG
jgi:membrane protein DedA with SNARE-associated domain